MANVEVSLFFQNNVILEIESTNSSRAATSLVAVCVGPIDASPRIHLHRYYLLFPHGSFSIFSAFLPST